jgi:hypothetical protein
MHKCHYKEFLHGKKKMEKEGKMGKSFRNASFHLWKLKRPMKTRFPSIVILLKKTLEFKYAMNLCCLK